MFFVFLSFFGFARFDKDSLKIPVLPQPSYVLFAQNKGQWNDKVLYEGKFKGGKVFLEQQGLSYVFFSKDGLEAMHHQGSKAPITYHAIKMDFVNCNLNSIVQETDSNTFYENYFIGKNPAKWASQVKSFKQIVYKNLYQGIDVKYCSQKNNFRFDFIVNPGADVSQLMMEFKGQNYLKVIEGHLILETEVGDIVQKAPYAYQIINGKEIEVNCSYVLQNKQVHFKIGNNYNKNYELIIDPTLVFATYTGSLSDNFGMTATYDVQGNAYTAGMCFGPSYPLSTGAFQINYMGGTGYGGDISVSKFNPTGSNLLYSTYLGGTGNESAESIIVDNLGELVVFGRSYSSDFPITSGVIQTSNAGGSDLIVTKFNTSGTALVASTYLGGTQDEGVNGGAFLGGLHYNYSDDLRGSVIVDDSNNVYIASNTISSNFPVTPGCFQNTLNGSQDACVAKLKPGLNALIFSTYFGGSAMDGGYNIALNANDELYVTGGTNSSDFYTTAGSVNPTAKGGVDGFLSLFSFNGNSVQASTYIGTSLYDQSYFVQMDKQNRVYVFGQTEGSYPVSAGVYSNPNSGQFIHCFNSSLTSSFFSTVVGSGDGFPDISPSAFLVDVCGSIYMSGWGGTLYNQSQPNSSTTGLPVTSNAFMSATDGRDFYFMVLNPNALSLQYATFFGGNLSHEHVDGGTSRFDKSGIIYQSICESCGGNDDMPATPTAWSTQNGSTNCNNAVVKFTFNSNLTIAQLSTNPTNPTGCLPLAVSFVNNSVNGVNYFWDFGDGATSTAYAPAHTYTSVGVYTVQLISNNNATCNVYDTTYTTVTVLPLIALNPLPASQTGCAPLIVNFSNSNNSTSASYVWNFGDGTSATTYSTTHTYTAIGVYTVQLISQNNASCIVFDTTYTTINVVSILTLSPLPAIQSGCAPLQVNFTNANSSFGVTYSWDFGDGNTSTAFAPVHTYSASGIFTVQLISFSSNSCNTSDTVFTTVTVMPPLSLVSPLSQNICLGDSIQINLGAPAGCTFTWTPNTFINNANIQQPNVSPPASQLYHVTVEKNGCLKNDSAQIFVFKNDTKIVLDPAHACIDDTVKLFANQVCSSYFWSSGQSTATINAFTPGWYYLTTISNNCLYKDSIRVDSFTHVSMNTYSISLCLNDKKQLFGPLGYNYEWSPAYEIDYTDIYNPFVSPKYDVTYTLNIYNGPCLTTGTYDVKVYSLPSLTVTPKSIEVFSGEVVQMYAASDTISVWEPDYMLSCLACNNNAAIVPTNITYYAIVYNEYGCMAKDSVEIKVTPTLYIPNSFSPNGDLLNDVFKPEYSGFVEIELLIFDRWGENIFRTEDLNGGWNGTYKNVNCELGVYTYKLTAKDIKSKTIEKVGHVTLLR